MTPATLAAGVAALVRAESGVRVLGWEPTEQGMNSVTVLLRLPTGARVAKWVPAAHAEALRSGALVAEELAGLGVRAGSPLRWATGGVTHPLDDGEVALLDFVTGEPLTPRESDQDDWGSALGRLHRLLARPRGSIERFLDAVGLSEPHPPLEQWVQDALADALDELRRGDQSRWVQLHTDPTPDAFRRASDGDVGTIDWTGSAVGPALYDVASAVMYAGGRAEAARLVESYHAAVGVPAESERDGLEAFGRMRAVVQAVYFSRRLFAEDVTGVSSQRDDERGLRDAQRMIQNG